MRARDVMSKSVLAVSPETGAPEAARLMRSKRIHHLLVKDGSRRAGILSDRDVGARFWAKGTADRTVADLMTPSVVTVDANATIRQIANLMRGRSIGCVVVTERERTVGVITISDLLDLIGRGVERPITPSRRHVLHHRVGHRHRATSAGSW
jgi:acetoin utilization protein AcuB